MPLPPPIDVQALEALVGIALADFTDAVTEVGGVVRVVSVDGEARMVTLDYSPRRVNVAVSGPNQAVVSIEGLG